VKGKVGGSERKKISQFQKKGKTVGTGESRQRGRVFGDEESFSIKKKEGARKKMAQKRGGRVGSR